MTLGERFTDMKSLGRITTETAEHIPGRTCFHTFGNDLEAKIVPQFDDLAHDGHILPV